VEPPSITPAQEFTIAAAEKGQSVALLWKENLLDHVCDRRGWAKQGMDSGGVSTLPATGVALLGWVPTAGFSLFGKAIGYSECSALTVEEGSFSATSDTGNRPAIGGAIAAVWNAVATILTAITLAITTLGLGAAATTLKVAASDAKSIPFAGATVGVKSAGTVLASTLAAARCGQRFTTAIEKARPGLTKMVRGAYSTNSATPIVTALQVETLRFTFNDLFSDRLATDINWHETRPERQQNERV